MHLKRNLKVLLAYAPAIMYTLLGSALSLLFKW